MAIALASMYRQLIAQRAALMPAPVPYRAPDVIRAAVNVASSAPVLQSAPASSSAPAPSSGGCGGRCGGHTATTMPAPAVSSALVYTGNESPTSGPFNVSTLPSPADLAARMGDGDQGAAAAPSEKEKGTLVWVLVVIVLFFLLYDPKKGSRKKW